MPPVSGLAAPAAAKPREPDWSWQDEAVSRCLDAIGTGSAAKIGLIVPTGGGKTRVALRVALDWLSRSAGPESQVLWVTHREHLRDAALRTLEDLAQTMRFPDDPLADGLRRTFASRVQFALVQSITPTLQSLGDDLGLVIVDEAHHAAADSYAEVVGLPVPGLFLTATPNRADNLPIGIDEIAYTTTYRELFQRGCVVEPTFHPPIDLAGLDWSSAAGLRQLADVVLDGCERQFAKALVAVTQQDRAEVLHSALVDALADRVEHPLRAEDLAFVHGTKNSLGLSTSVFLESFGVRRRGVLVGTSQLIGEGFDDPFIDAVITTYPSTSISHLMQVAGRAMRYSPEKRAAHVIQVHESALEYHFEQRWLYQDISDRWHPSIIDWEFATPQERDLLVLKLLEDHHVAPAVVSRVAQQLRELQPSEEVRVMLSGLPYFGAPEAFEESSKWGAILVTDRSRPTFVRLFNTVSDRDDDLKDESAFVGRFVSKDVGPGSEFLSYIDLIAAVEYARRELRGDGAAGQERRPFHQRRSSTWLRYHVFSHEPALPGALDGFLDGAINRSEVAAAFVVDPQRWRAALRISLPVEGWYAWLLDGDGVSWFEAQVASVGDRVRREAPADSLAAVAAWRHNLRAAPIPQLMLERFDELTREVDRDRFFLTIG